METTTQCDRCGSNVTDPRGRVLHRFAEGDTVTSSAGMAGTVVRVPDHHRGRFGLTVVWENGHRGKAASTNLVHGEATR